MAARERCGHDSCLHRQPWRSSAAADSVSTSPKSPLPRTRQCDRISLVRVPATRQRQQSARHRASATTIGELSFSDGNTALRTPFIGFNPNADLWTAEGISNYNALQLQVTKRMSHGLEINASYTYPHSLDEGSGLGAGLFFTGNNPLNPRASYASLRLRSHTRLHYQLLYQFPTMHDVSRFVDALANGWAVQGVTVAQTGAPFSVIDFSGTAAASFIAPTISSPIRSFLSLPAPLRARPSRAVRIRFHLPARTRAFASLISIRTHFRCHC